MTSFECIQFIAGLVDNWPEILQPHRKKFTLGMVVFMLLLGIPMITNVILFHLFILIYVYDEKQSSKFFLQFIFKRCSNYLSFKGGMYVFQLMDFYAASGLSLLWCVFFQTIAICWVFGAKQYYLCIEQMIGYKVIIIRKV